MPNQIQSDEVPRRRRFDHVRIALVLALVALLAVFVSACGGGDDSTTSSGGGSETGGGSSETTTAASSEPLFFANIAGPAVEGGGDFTKGVEIAAKRINAEGGVDGRKIEVKEYDKGLTPETAVAAYKQAASDGALTAWFGGPAGVSAAAAQAARIKVPIFEVTGNIELVEPPMEYVYATSWDKQYPGTVVRWAVENEGTKKIAVLHFTTDYSEKIPSDIEEACEIEGCELVDAETGELEASVEELVPLLTKMKNSGADTYYIETLNPNAAKAARQLGMFDKPIISEQWLSVPAIAEATGKAGEDIVFSAQKCLDPSLAEAGDSGREWCENYRKEFAEAYPGEPYALFSAYGDDAVTMFAGAAAELIEAGEEVTPETLNEKYENMNGSIQTSHGFVESTPENHHLTGPFEQAYLLYELVDKGGEITYRLARDASPKGASIPEE